MPSDAPIDLDVIGELSDAAIEALAALLIEAAIDEITIPTAQAPALAENT